MHLCAMAMPSRSVWDTVTEFTKVAQDTGTDPSVWLAQVSSSLRCGGIYLPSVEFAHFLVSHICWRNNVPLAWKYLEHVIQAKLAPPILILALLSVRVIPSRHLCPVAYRLYLELIKRFSFLCADHIADLNCQRVMRSTDEALMLAQNFGIPIREPGILVVEFLFAIIWQLLESVLDDVGILDLIQEKPRWAVKVQNAEVGNEDNLSEKQSEHHEELNKINSMMALQLIVEFLQHKMTSRLLHLAAQNMTLQWEGFVQRLQLLAANSSSISISTLSPEALLQLASSYMLKQFDLEWRSGKRHGFHVTGISRPFTSSQDHSYGVTSSALWIPLDSFLEDCMDGSQVAASCAIEILTGLMKSLRAFNGSSWHEAFLAVWLAALRLVQREQVPVEGPVPRLVTRMCILLSITTLSIADIIEEDEHLQVEHMGWNCNQKKGNIVSRSGCKDLISSLQLLGDYEGLLTPPPSVLSLANQAAAKAVMFVSGIPIGSSYPEYITIADIPVHCSGSLWHLIVEACISRNLLDTSAYFWPGYVNGQFNQIPRALSGQVPSWSALMKGAPLTPSLVNSLVSTPASCLIELEKIFEIVVSGSEHEKAFAASVLCGASLIRGWNIQEHTVCFIMKLLSPSAPADYTGAESHLLSHIPVLYILLLGISPEDCVQIFSLHGLVPELAAVLMKICEDLGSCVPNVFWTLPTGEKISVHAVFSCAFILLLRLWRFNHSSLEHCVYGESAPLGSQLTPEYLLLLHNSSIMSTTRQKDRVNRWQASKIMTSTSKQPIFLDSFPKLKLWHRQHQACIASPLSGLIHGTPAQQLVDDLLRMMFRKLNSGGTNQSISTGVLGDSSLSSSSSTSSEDYSMKPQLPAWHILEAVPFVLDSALAACSYGRLSPRDLATGLKDLADFLPASIATIVSYFSAEVTRGIWNPAFMNGTDWPSAAANLCAVEEHIKKIVATTGVSVPSLNAGCTPATLPLPLAAFVSFTITYKLDRASELLLNLAGPALESLAAGCRWPSMPIVAALWAQKVKRWNNFLIFSASRTVFQQNTDAVVQLLKSCFFATLDLSAAHMSSCGGVGCLLGHGFGFHSSGSFSPVAPGILYLRIHRSIQDVTFLPEKILFILMLCVKEVAGQELDTEKVIRLKKISRGGRKDELISLDVAMMKVKVAATLGASLLWLSGGSSLVKILLHETLPSWLLSSDSTEYGVMSDVTGFLRGYALAHFAVLCGAFSWGVEVTSVTERQRWVLKAHIEFLASVLDGRINLGCDLATWQAYVLEFVGLVLRCAPTWVTMAEIATLKSLYKGLWQWNEQGLAIALLEVGGTRIMGAAAQMIIAGSG